MYVNYLYYSLGYLAPAFFLILNMSCHIGI